MRKIREAFRSSAFALVVVSIVGINVVAQEKKQEESSTNVLRPAIGVQGAVLQPLPQIAPMLSLGRVGALRGLGPGGSGIVKNAPFSAEMVYESIQTLFDGNRIINRSSTMVYRDSQGRTRNEYSFKPYLKLRYGGENIEHKTISIFDPVSGINYTLDPQTRTAHKFTIPQPANNTFTFATPVIKSNTFKVESTDKPQGKSANTGACGPFLFASPGGSCNGESSAKHEPLGKQMIEGVEAEGTRITQTIPAGTMGNERPMEIFHERWYSQELQMDVMVKWFDPRSGESTQRLTNIYRGEPDASLFQPPSDYTIREPEIPRALIKRLREKNREPKDQ
jgi:hypothetical protein